MARLLNKLQINTQWFSRFALFLIYFWFGVLKILSLSPASELVKALHNQTIPFIDFSLFFILFGLFEALLGIMFLFPKLTRITKVLFFLHIFTTSLPLILLPQMVWTGFLVPTLEGQYIIKNIVLIALVLNINEEK